LVFRFHEPVEVRDEDVDWRQTVKIVEDYKQLDIPSGP